MANLLLCVGNIMMGDDGAGPLLAERCLQGMPANWTVVDGGAAPENDIGHIRDLRPDRLVIVDATEMGLVAGETRVIDAEAIAELFITTTHNLPLSFLIDQLRPDIPEITFIGIQPETVAFYYPVSAAVTQAVDRFYRRMAHWLPDGGYPRLMMTND